MATKKTAAKQNGTGTQTEPEESVLQAERLSANHFTGCAAHRSGANLMILGATKGSPPDIALAAGISPTSSYLVHYHSLEVLLPMASLRVALMPV